MLINLKLDLLFPVNTTVYFLREGKIVNDKIIAYHYSSVYTGNSEIIFIRPSLAQLEYYGLVIIDSSNTNYVHLEDSKQKLICSTYYKQTLKNIKRARGC